MPIGRTRYFVSPEVKETKIFDFFWRQQKISFLFRPVYCFLCVCGVLSSFLLVFSLFVSGSLLASPHYSFFFASLSFLCVISSSLPLNLFLSAPSLALSLFFFFFLESPGRRNPRLHTSLYPNPSRLEFMAFKPSTNKTSLLMFFRLQCHARPTMVKGLHCRGGWSDIQRKDLSSGVIRKAVPFFISHSPKRRGRDERGPGSSISLS